MRVGVVHATEDNKTYSGIVYVDIVSVYVTSDSVYVAAMCEVLPMVNKWSQRPQFGGHRFNERRHASKAPHYRHLRPRHASHNLLKVALCETLLI